jgi:hypothetical protein
MVKTVEEPRATITYITRELKSGFNYAYIETTEHTETVADSALAEFIGRYPRLNGRLTRSDYLFTLQLAQNPELKKLLTFSTGTPNATGGSDNASHLKCRLSTIPHVHSAASRRGAYSESIAQIDSAHPVDLIKIALLLQSLECSKFRRMLGRILVTDIQDSSTEYGGAIVLSGQSDCPLSLDQIPSENLGDYEYRPPTELLHSASLALWHNHAAAEKSTDPLDMDNSARAGPSGTLRGSLVQVGGDMWQCYIHGVDAVIVTPVGRGKYNVDFVSSDGIVLDLGLYSYAEVN